MTEPDAPEWRLASPPPAKSDVWSVTHATCGQVVQRDEYGILDMYHDTNACRGSAHHPKVAMPKSDRSQLG